MSARSERYAVAQLESLSESVERVTIENKTYLVCAFDDEVYAYRNVCPHQKGPVAEGHVDEECRTVTCPWHGWEFDLEEGKNLIETGAGDRLPQAKTEVEDGTVYIVRR